MFKRVDIKTGFLCNNNCMFCVQAHKKQFGNRKTDEIKKDLKAAHANNCSGVVFTGGEATLRKDLIEIVRYAKRLGFTSIQLQTNARMLRYMDLCKELVNAGVNEFSPAIHGHTKELHDYLTRSKGAFFQVIRAIKNLRKLNQYIVTNTVVCKPNYRNLPDIARMLIDLKVDQFQFAFMHAVGNAQIYYDKLMPCISMAAPYIKQGLQIGIDNNLKVMAEGMTPCTMKGYEKYCSENFIPATEIRDLDCVDLDFEKTRLTEGKKKFKTCKGCIYYTTCEGPWREYPEKKGKDEFKPIIPKALNGTCYKEFIAMKEGIKKAQRTITRRKEVKELRKVYEQNNFFSRVSDYSVKLKKGLITRKKEGEKVIVYASKDKKVAEKLKMLEEKHDMIRSGKLLGYPDCCIKFFAEHHNKPTPSIYFEALKNTKQPRAILNIIEEQFSNISHIPCSFECEESIRYAEKIVEITGEQIINRSYIFFEDGSFIRLRKKYDKYIPERFEPGQFQGHMALDIKSKVMDKVLRIRDRIMVDKRELDIKIKWRLIEFR